MGADEPFEVVRDDILEQLRRILIAEVSEFAPDSLFDRPGVGAVDEHFHVVVELQDESLKPLEPPARQVRSKPHVGGEADAAAILGV